MRKVRILQFTIRNFYGGITHYAMNNWKYIDKNKFEFDFATVGSKLDYEDILLSSGAGVKYISCYAEDNLERFTDEVRTILMDGRYDVIHLHTSIWKSFFAEKIALECKVPKIIVHAHSTRIDRVDDEERKKAGMLHELRKKEFNETLATDFWACSWLAADWLFGEQIPRDKIKIMKNAIDVEQFAFNKKVRESYRRKLGLEDAFVIGHVGRFAYQKNHEFLLNVFAKVRKQVSNARLLLVGDGELKEDVRNKAIELGIIDSVVFTGGRQDVNNILQAMDVFCLPSRFEGFPIVLVEAQTTGIKCLVSESITTEIELTDNIKYLHLDIEAWARCIIEISKGYQRRDMSDIITEAGYNIKYQIKELEELYSV